MSDKLESQAETEGKGKKKDCRGRAVAFLVYGDSSYPDWKERLRDQHVRGFISPCHDRDLLADGSLKKEHWHVMLMFEGKKSRVQIDELREAALGPDFNKELKDLINPGAYARYLVHMDDPDKAQYRKEDVICLGGADYDLATSMPGDDAVTMAKISTYVVSADITSVNQLIKSCQEQGRRDWLQYISRRGYVIGMMIGHNIKRLSRIKSGDFLPGDIDSGEVRDA